jgi:uncharacterized protein YndB with AHSA1/START domain
MAIIRQTYQFNADPRKVYQAIATPEGVRAWWSEDSQCQGDGLRVGFGAMGEIKLGMDETVENEYVELSCVDGKFAGAPRSPWIGTRLRFELEPKQGGTQLRFSHSGHESEQCEFYQRVTGGWKHFLDGSLRAYLEKGSGTPLACDGSNAPCKN